MGPKKKGGKKGGKGKKAPKADPGWAKVPSKFFLPQEPLSIAAYVILKCTESHKFTLISKESVLFSDFVIDVIQKTTQYGKWERPFESLPDAITYPTYAPIRENFLAAVKDLEMIWSPTMEGVFLEEFFKIPRPNLERMDIRGAYLLKQFIISPYGVLPALTYLDISCMAVLEFVLIQCPSLEWLTLARSKSLTKALIETRNLKELVIDTCEKLGTLMVWSDQLTSLKGLTDSKELQKLVLYCPLLVDYEKPEIYVPEVPKVFHPTIIQMRKWEDKKEALPPKEFGLLPKDLDHGHENQDILHEELGYPNRPHFPRTQLLGL